MYAKRTLILAVAIVAVLVLTAASASQLQDSNAIAQPSLSVTRIAATPNTISPIDVLTVSTSVTSATNDADGLTVKILVRDESGQIVLQEQQRGIGVPGKGTQSVYWVWRIPSRVADGTYTIETVVLDSGNQVLATDSQGAAFIVERTEAQRARGM